MRILYRGFTITEVIVVVAILTLISAMVVQVLSGTRQKSHAIALLNQIQALETALVTYRNYELTGGWPRANYNDTQTELSVIVGGTSTAFPGFDEYFSGRTDVFSDYEVRYGFPTGMAAYRCPGDGTEYDTGVNIRLAPTPISANLLRTYYDIMNEKMDGDDPDTGCGKLRIDAATGNVYYNIASSTHSY